MTTPLIHERVLQRAADHSESLAVVSAGSSLRYGELAERSLRIAAVLEQAGCKPGDRVCLFLPKEPDTIAAMLGCLVAGCAYVPVDLASPAKRAVHIVNAADPRIGIVDPGAAGLVDGILAQAELPAIAFGTLASESLDGERFSCSFTGEDIALAEQAAPRRGAEGDVAHILFTSGSTGVPKGVVITQANVTGFLNWAVAAFGIAADDRFSCHPPLHFDLSTFDVFGALTSGAELHIPPPRANLLPQALSKFIADARLTQWFSVPSTMAFMAHADAVPDGGFPELRRVLACGEVLPTPVLASWMRRLPHVAFWNLYGPTEATIASGAHRIREVPTDETEAVPIGRACQGEELVVLDEELLPVPTGTVGDLFIGGVGLSPGYWRDEERTRAAFLPDPRGGDGRLYRTGDLAWLDETGTAHFVGRADTQVKSRGYRIELGEIETALNAIDWIAESAVIGIPTEGFEGTLIGCAFAQLDGSDNGPVEVRAALSRTLPAYMLPTRWLALPSLPKNANGKIDRVALRDELAAANAGRAQRGGP